MLKVSDEARAEYQKRVREHDSAWARQLTPAERFALYEDLYGVLSEARANLGDWSQLEDWSWQEKVALRRRLVSAFAKLDQVYSERSPSNDPN